jgi:hypothetical protein
VGASDHLDTAQNGVWFQLRNASHRNPQLQAAWNAHGEAVFEFEILEKFDDKVSALLVGDIMKDRQAYWENTLGARRLY